MPLWDDTRADWNARQPLRPLTRVDPADRLGVSWHWLGDGHGPSAAGSHQRCLDRVRDWQAQHQDPTGRIRGKDLGYNGLICQHARAIEGRGAHVVGAHSPGVNPEHYGLQFMVGADDPFPSAAMIVRAVVLRAELEDASGHDLRDWAHRDDPEAATACPGDRIASWVHTGGPERIDVMSTPREVAAEVLGWDTVPAERIPFGTKRATVDLRTAAGYSMLWALEARDSARRTEEIVRTLAEKGGQLTPAEIEAAVDRAFDRRILDADVDVVVAPPS